MNKTTLKYKSCSLYRLLFWELAGTLFPVETTNNMENKTTCHRVIGDVCIWEESRI